MILINRIRLNLQETKYFEKAVVSAVTLCIENGILRAFLISHRSGVRDVVITEFGEKSFVKGINEKGRLQDLAEGQRNIIADLLRDGKSLESISDFCKFPMDLILNVQNSLLESK
ncbi:hypothetical protein [Oribacterium sp. WCC10]|uniref:hypothetical protein n=1 Tax=Oribacterium sp. WCC10 TaxID=1855343 RepID=UPI0008EE37E9|nr:hypothetical protein [Oribacterium sp. WCC10]SFG64015.1 hypothetical protein SAMN05216356_11654 [Oribacterium sp. WCC10]